MKKIMGNEMKGHVSTATTGVRSLQGASIYVTSDANGRHGQGRRLQSSARNRDLSKGRIQPGPGSARKWSIQLRALGENTLKAVDAKPLHIASIDNNNDTNGWQHTSTLGSQNFLEDTIPH